MLLYRDCKSFKKVNIKIVTYKRDYHKKDQETMTEPKRKAPMQSRFICSICLSAKPCADEKVIDTRWKTKSCPVCQRNMESDLTQPSKSDNEINTKKVQTSQTNITEGLHLLNEVLTVFQHKKLDEKKFTRDAAIATDNIKNGTSTQFLNNLSVSKVFNFSIEGGNKMNVSKFTVIDSHQPSILSKSHVNLTKHKSSSIPQMKVEELKKSLQEKTKSKDAVEEVNRMFATVRRIDSNENETNRPIVRNGPRVLPVVKNTCNVVDYIPLQERKYDFQRDAQQQKKTFNLHKKCDYEKKLQSFCCKTNNYHLSGGDDYEQQKQSFCCNTNNYHLSGGDSNHRCSHDNEHRQAQKHCVYTNCCDREIRQPNSVVCQCCGNRTEVRDLRDSQTSFT